jgi:GNAT superfamily N-acetyltransferase
MFIKFDDFWMKYIRKFEWIEYIYDERGYLVWREGTGNNIEILHLRAFEEGKGNGPRLIKEMLAKLKMRHTPYYSVFGFILNDNIPVKKMYRKLGMIENAGIARLYKFGAACIVCQDFEILCQKNL